MLCAVLGLLLGILIIIYGEIDDSPGAQLIGLVSFVLGVVGVVKSFKKSSGQKIE